MLPVQYCVSYQSRYHSTILSAMRTDGNAESRMEGNYVYTVGFGNMFPRMNDLDVLGRCLRAFDPLQQRHGHENY
jgi:hypothetical protein